MALILLDSSFLMLVASKPIDTFWRIEQQLGRIDFVTMDEILDELRALSRSRSVKTSRQAKRALEYALKLRRIRYDEQQDVDSKIFVYSKEHGAIVATLDQKLIRKLREAKVAVLTLRKDKVFLQ